MTGSYPSLTRDEAVRRRELLEVTGYDVRLDLDVDDATFGSSSRVSFTSAGGATFVDVKAVAIRTARLNGEPLDQETLRTAERTGRLMLNTAPGAGELVVEAVMGFRTDGEGLHRSVDPADGRAYVYAMSFMDAAPRIFACFDQPDLKAPVTLQVRAPAEWTVIANAPGSRVGPGEWAFEQSRPLSTYLVTLVAGPYYVINHSHDQIPLGLSARQSLAATLDADAEELLTLTGQCFDEFHRLFGIRYPFGHYHQAFVPEFNAGAMENPGCVTFRDPLLFSSRVTRGAHVQRATTVAHEMAHQWFGNLVTPRWWDDLWLNESFAEYLGNRVTAAVTEYADAWTHNAYARRQWGLVADQRPSTHPVAGNGAGDARTALQDFDGISYAKGSSILKQLNASLGDEAFFAGVVDLFERHRFGNAEMTDLFAAWERAAQRDLSDFTTQWLRTAGVDTLRVQGSTVTRTAPSRHPARREHAIRAAVAGADGWRVESLRLQEDRTPLRLDGEDRAVVLDPFEDSWALVLPDERTLAELPALLAQITDDALRAGIWNMVRSGFHNAAVDPEDVLRLLEATVPTEHNDDALGTLLPWALTTVAPLHAHPDRALARIGAAAGQRLQTAGPGSTQQLAAIHAMIGACDDSSRLRAWLAPDGLPTGVELDVDLRWRLLVRLAALGETDEAELDEQFDLDPTQVARVERFRARASRPDPAAKEWAWSQLRVGAGLSNYELQAIGLGFWRPGQETLTAPYVDRYLAEAPRWAETFSGWLLATVTESFFPITALDRATHARLSALSERAEVDPTIRRRILDSTDELGRRIAVRDRYSS